MTTTQTPTVSATLAKIRERGYWRVVIRPRRFDATVFPDISALYPFVTQHAVRLQEWEFPQTRVNSDYRTGIDWIDHQSEWHQHLEYWRIYQSGQFVDYRAFEDDWRDRSTFSPAPIGWQPGQYLEVARVVGTLTDIFEFAVRLALTEAYAVDSSMHIAVTLRGLQGRSLYSATPERELHALYRAGIDELPLVYDLPRDQVIADARKLATSAARQVFLRFGADLQEAVLSYIQEEIVR